MPFLFARGKGRIYPWLLAPVPVVGPCRRTYLNGLRQDRELGCRVFFTLSHVQAVASICDFCFACDLAGLVFVQAFLQNSRVEGIHAEMPRQWMYSVNLCVSMCTYLNIFSIVGLFTCTYMFIFHLLNSHAFKHQHEHSYIRHASGTCKTCATCLNCASSFLRSFRHPRFGKASTHSAKNGAFAN